MRRTRVRVFTAFILLTDLGRHIDQAGSTEILGWWHGTSTCVREAWNTACNDEKILHEFVAAPPDSNHSLLHASKIVEGQVVPMGDLPIPYAAARGTWEGAFANARVSIRWAYELHGDTLTGQLFLQPNTRVARQVVALRGKVTIF